MKEDPISMDDAEEGCETIASSRNVPFKSKRKWTCVRVIFMHVFCLISIFSFHANFILFLCFVPIYSHRHALEHVYVITSLHARFCTFTPFPSSTNSSVPKYLFSTPHLCNLTLRLHFRTSHVSTFTLFFDFSNKYLFTLPQPTLHI